MKAADGDDPLRIGLAATWRIDALAIRPLVDGDDVAWLSKVRRVLDRAQRRGLRAWSHCTVEYGVMKGVGRNWPAFNSLWTRQSPGGEVRGYTWASFFG